jgi:Ca2+-binding RTX toxin-like protein
MATYTFTGISGANLTISGGVFTVNGTVSLSSSWTSPTNALTFTFTDNDTALNGDTVADEIGDDIDQVVVVTNASGLIVASGRAYVEQAVVVSDGEGNSLSIGQVEVGGTVVGYVVDGAMVPGVTYQIGSIHNISDSSGSYSFIDNQTWNATNANLADGGAYNDTLATGSGNDTVSAGGGADLVQGGSGSDSLDGGSGNDTIYGGSENDVLTGGAGTDSLYGEAGNDTLYGGDGDDGLAGGAGSDTVYGDAGTDGFGIYDNSDYDSVVGGESTGDNDYLWLGTATTSQGVVVTFTGSEAGTADFVGSTAFADFSQIEVVFGTNVGDTINAAADSSGIDIYGQDGSDVLTGGSGSDMIIGGAGQDSLSGGAASDNLQGGDGNDSISGGEGGDYITGDAGSDSLYGDAGDDTLLGGSENDTMYGGDGNDSLNGGTGVDLMYGGAGNDTITTVSGNDSLNGEAGSDTFNITQSTDFAFVDGGESTNDLDVLDLGSFSALTGGVTVSVWGDGNGSWDWTTTNGAGQFSNIEALSGSNGADLIDGSGGSGNLSQSGNAGSDTLKGGSGNDTLRGGADNDTLTGGAGSDVYVIDANGGRDTITDFARTDGNGDGRYDDQLNISGLSGGTGVGGAVTNTDIAISADPNGNAVLTFPNGEQVVLIGTSPNQVNQTTLFAMGVTCFVAGTRIETPHGPRAIEEIRVGDTVISATTGAAVPVLWAGHRTVSHKAMVRRPELRPVEIERFALGNRDAVLLSPSHAVAQGLGTRSRLFRAAQLERAVPGVRRLAAKDFPLGLTYHHIYLDQHDLVLANGVLCETFLPGPLGMAMLGQNARQRLITLRQSLGRAGPEAPVLPYATGDDVRQLARLYAGTSRLSQNHTDRTARAVAIRTLAAATRLPKPKMLANR